MSREEKEKKKKQLLEETMRYLAPHYRFVMSLFLSRNFLELELVKKRIDRALNTKANMVSPYPEDAKLNINLKRLGQTKGKEWLLALKKQLRILVQAIGKFERG